MNEIDAERSEQLARLAHAAAVEFFSANNQAFCPPWEKLDSYSQRLWRAIAAAVDSVASRRTTELADDAREQELGSIDLNDESATFGQSLAAERWAVRQNELSLRHRQSRLMAFQMRQAGHLDKAADCEASAAFYLALFRQNQEHASDIIAGRGEAQ